MIFTFLTSWNAYFRPLVVHRDDRSYLLTVAPSNVVALIYRQEYGVILAGAVVGSGPIILLFLALQGEFISGLTLGAVKR